ncbi:hypothetical protein SAMN05421493_106137 [Pseudobutyrivibrio sp. 49]|uniref:hypothetical protein n=1 Tax=Pseudobutyrivibrio sp. 49 TaxID=1855344 RepID=UPI00088E12C0|nr:hypothetical protein [Pseudobutyrivibrio sp. 49]SDH99892.1 hypothetical protein SAMN05421493_106137 [Pseudobutyrivibrio sp. 49]
MVLILECIVVCFILFLPCVVVIANGTEQGAFLYEKDVQDRVVEMGLISKAQIEKNGKLFKLCTLTVMIAFVLWSVYGINGVRGFIVPFLQIYAMTMAEGLFDRFFIDWYWVEHTKAWTIPGTEDLRPYIPKKTNIVKWLITIVGNPIIAAVLAGIMMIVL